MALLRTFVSVLYPIPHSTFQCAHTYAHTPFSPTPTSPSCLCPSVVWLSVFASHGSGSPIICRRAAEERSFA
ncbi:hypothetical protein FIBSPDRAFT_863190 [Athelia psychrophila]|uniref:Uncharacterized protein n=1 Tax=Athelia psychrophila TaxID=1759441 RepID=A0A166HMH9_9AGAM|nr:hypothetical protein FIBSPDRAFT_863190 [Fibularhizoctonia sp. CBS 109695]